MDNLKEIFKNLRTYDVKDGNDTKTIEKTLWLNMKPNHKYELRFIPYAKSEESGVETQYTYWYHNIKDDTGKSTKYLCSQYDGVCQACAEKHNKFPANLANVHVISSDDPKITDNEYYVLNIDYRILKEIQTYEKENVISLFDLYKSPTVIIKPNGKPNSIYPSYDENCITFSAELSPIKPNIENDSSQDIWDFIINVPKNLKLLNTLSYYGNTKTTIKVPENVVIEQNHLIEKKDVIQEKKIVINKRPDNVEKTKKIDNSMSDMDFDIDALLDGIDLSD